MAPAAVCARVSTVGILVRWIGNCPPGSASYWRTFWTGLDDVFDQQPGANVWLWRLLRATTEALIDSRWANPMATAAEGVELSLRNQEDTDLAYERILMATDGLRRMLAEAV